MLHIRYLVLLLGLVNQSLYASVSISVIQEELKLMEPVIVNITIENSTDTAKYYLFPGVNRFGRSGVKFLVNAPTQQSFSTIEHPDIFIGGHKMRACQRP